MFNKNALSIIQLFFQTSDGNTRTHSLTYLFNSIHSYILIQSMHVSFELKFEPSISIEEKPFVILSEIFSHFHFQSTTRNMGVVVSLFLRFLFCLSLSLYVLYRKWFVLIMGMVDGSSQFRNRKKEKHLQLFTWGAHSIILIDIFSFWLLFLLLLSCKNLVLDWFELNVNQ